MQINWISVQSVVKFIVYAFMDGINVSVDYHSFQDGESACKEECHQHTLKTLIPQIVAPGTHS